MKNKKIIRKVKKQVKRDNISGVSRYNYCFANFSSSSN